MKFGDLFDCFDSIAAFADDVGVPHWRASKWKQRGSIPTDSWPDVITALSRKGKKVSADDLLIMHSTPRRAASARASR